MLVWKIILLYFTKKTSEKFFHKTINRKVKSFKKCLFNILLAINTLGLFVCKKQVDVYIRWNI